ncbi:MAG: hypothetical protein COV36_06305 [Alphaproteobacteria bacterium CG11_big_fil_rev_8_21_14_0_20_44_7]|nr:MAG: hypothetical protein COV36_06305 [Alphaproteobacteria bacterium CG11_big_fil_rev_8_21_14_0_20_44_7]
MKYKGFKLLSAVSLSAITMVIASNEVQADSEFFQPYFEAGMVLEWQNEYRADSDDATIDDTNNSFLNAEFVPVIGINEYMYFDAVLIMEPLDQAATLNANDDIWFDREGIFFEELKFNFEQGNYHFMIGKFNPVFGTAWDKGHGIWGADFAEDYEITEKLGFGGSYTFETKENGSYTTSLAVFKADKSILSSSEISKRDRARLSDGGASNTDGMESFSFGLDVENAFGIENLAYHVGYRSLAEQDSGQGATTDDENGYVLGLSYLTPITDEVEVDLLGEIALINNFAGVRNDDYSYYTAGAQFFYENWNAALSHTVRDIDATGVAGDFTDNLSQISGGYDFGNGFSAEVGYKIAEEANVDTDTAGFLLRYTREL